MPNIVYDLIEPAVLVRYVRAFDNEVLRPEGRFNVLERWLPNRPTEDLEVRVRKGALNDVNIAEFRAFDTPSRMTGRQGTKFVRGSLGPVSRAIPLGEEELLRQRSLDRASNDPLLDQIYADAEMMIRAVQGRIELARGDIIDDAVVEISENGLELEADFGRHTDLSETAGTVWTNPASHILDDLLAYVETYVDHNGVNPGVLLMPQTRLANFALNDDLRDYASFAGTTPMRLNQATIGEILTNEGLPPIMLYDGQVRINGVRTRILPEEKVFLMPPAGEDVGETLYGTTAEALKLRAKGMITREEAPGLVAVILENDHPVQTVTNGVGLALPIMPNPDLIMDIIVAA